MPQTPEEKIEHNWFPLCSDINSSWWDTYHWWRCSNCEQETEHTKDNNVPMPSRDACKAKEQQSIFPLSTAC